MQEIRSSFLQVCFLVVIDTEFYPEIVLSSSTALLKHVMPSIAIIGGNFDDL